MRVLPILFNTDMVQAILRKVNPKTTTRRTIKGYIPIDAVFGYSALTPKGYISCFLCNKKREYQKRCDRAYEQEKQARKFLKDEPDREDLKSTLNYAITLQDRYSALIDFIEELQKVPIAYDVDEVIDRLEERATDNRRMALLSGNKEFTYREDEDMKAIEIIKVEMRG